MASIDSSSAAAFQKGQQVEHYQIVEVLTPTRFGHTYLGRHIHQSAQVSIEGLLPPLLDELQADFLKGAQALQQLEHPHILRVRGAGVHQSYPFLVTDYLPYRTLHQVYAPGGIPPLMVFLPYLKKVASALHYAHSRSIVHGDIRPENILLSAHNNILLRGFLLEAIMQNRSRRNYRGAEAAERDAMLYAAPEQIQGNGSYASDQYALGVVIYKLLCGHTPFRGSVVEIAFQKMHAPAPSLRQRLPDVISPGVERVVMKALDQEPAKRFPDVQTFIDALEQEQDQLSVHLGAAAPVQKMIVPAPPLASSPAVLAPSPFNLADTLPAAPSPASGGSPAKPAERVPREVKKAEPKQASPDKPSNRQKGPSMTRRVFAVGMVGFAALGGAAGWYLLTQRFAQASLPVVSVQADPPATQVTVNNRKVLIFTGHLASVNALAWSPDGTSIASASDDTFVQVFDAATGTRKIIYRGHTEEVAAVAWSPDSKYIASAGQDRTVQLWDAASGSAPVLTYTGHTDRVNSVAWSNDGQALLSGSDDKSVQVWQAGNGARIFTFQGHTAGVLCVGWQPDQSSVASGSWDGTLRDWAMVQHGDHFDAGEQIFNYGGHGSNEVYSLAWSPDGSLIASAGADQTVQISNGGDGTPVPPSFTDHQRKDHTNRVFAVSWSPDGTSIASGDQDGNVYVWNAANRLTYFKYTGHQGAVNAVAWSPDGKYIASGSADMTVHVWQPGLTEDTDA